MRWTMSTQWTSLLKATAPTAKSHRDTPSQAVPEVWNGLFQTVLLDPVELADGESLRAVARGARRPGGALAGEAGRGRELERVDPATPFARQLRQT
jgi:hypothetical protein